MKDWIWDIPKITMILLNFVFVLPLFMEIIKNLNLISMEFLLHFSVSIHPQQWWWNFGEWIWKEDYCTIEWCKKLSSLNNDVRIVLYDFLLDYSVHGLHCDQLKGWVWPTIKSENTGPLTSFQPLWSTNVFRHLASRDVPPLGEVLPRAIFPSTASSRRRCGIPPSPTSFGAWMKTNEPTGEAVVESGRPLNIRSL